MKGASLGQTLALPANIRLGWKGLPGTNTLVYYENPYITAVKSFIVQAPAVEPILTCNHETACIIVQDLRLPRSVLHDLKCALLLLECKTQNQLKKAMPRLPSSLNPHLSLLHRFINYEAIIINWGLVQKGCGTNMLECFPWQAFPT